MREPYRAIVRRLERKQAELWREAERRSDAAQNLLALEINNRACGVGEAIEEVKAEERGE